ncbi:UNVERIFIED_CONTAM: hypothetical protein GTU68_066820 [Idotea baltica]|nr:hypothetical protein [Idotea baltica]
MSKGASDYAAKPTNTGTAVSSIDQIRQELVTKIIEFGSHTEKAAARTHVSLAVSRQTKSSSVKALLIGSSTGGPAALEKVLTGLTRPLPIPIIIVQHMPATFTGVLASRLNSCCSFPVHEVAQGMKIEAGSCYVAAGGHHLKLAATGLNVTVVLDDGPKVKSCRPSVDVMFDSATKAYGGSVLATVLTGMGDDGLDSARRLVEKGIDVIVQDEATSVVWGMPGAIAKAGLASLCLPLDQIASAIVKKTSLSGLGSVARPVTTGATARSAARPAALTSPERRQ